MTWTVAPLPRRCTLRRPTTAEGGMGAALARANQRDVEAAHRRLAAVLPGVAEPGGRGPTQPVASEHRGPVRADVDALVAQSTTASGDGSGRADGTAAGPAPVRRLDGEGAVAAGVAAWVDDLAAVWAARVAVDLLVGGPDEAGCRSWEGHDTLLVALAAPLAVDLTAPAVEAAIPGATAAPSGPPLWEGEVAPGHALLVPRGWGMGRRAPGGVWLEVSLRRPRGTDVAAAVVEHLAGQLPFRHTLRWDARTGRRRPSDLFDDPTALDRPLEALDLDRCAREAVAAWRAELTPLDRADDDDAARAAAGDAPAVVAGPGGWVLVDALPPGSTAGHGSGVTVARAGRLVTASPADLERLCGEVVPIEAVADLHRAGLLRRAP